METSWRAETFVIDRAFRDVSNLKISDLYKSPFGQKVLLKSSFLMKIRVFRRGFSQDVSLFEGWFLYFGSTICGLQPHEKISVGSLKKFSSGNPLLKTFIEIPH
jgi:hypothetical protein